MLVSYVPSLDYRKRKFNARYISYIEPLCEPKGETVFIVLNNLFNK